jgi:hypothetical protein
VGRSAGDACCSNGIARGSGYSDPQGNRAQPLAHAEQPAGQIVRSPAVTTPSWRVATPAGEGHGPSPYQWPALGRHQADPPRADDLHGLNTTPDRMFFRPLGPDPPGHPRAPGRGPATIGELAGRSGSLS